MTDANGDGLPGVSIRIKDTTVGTVSDVNGNFSIDCCVGDILIFSYIGFEDLEIVAKEGSITGVMKEASLWLDENL